MKKSLLVLLISLLPLMSSFSQTIYPKLLNDSSVVISAKQLKQTNLIFLEHQYLKNINGELNKQVSYYRILCNNYQGTDSLKTKEIQMYSKENEHLNSKVNNQITEINKLKDSKRKWEKWTIGGFSLSTVLLGLLFIR